MKFSTESTMLDSYRSFIYIYPGVLAMPPLLIASVGLCLMYPQFWPAALPLAVLALFFILSSIEYAFRIKRQLGENGKVVWSYNLQPNVIHMSVGPLNLRYERSLVKSYKIYQHAVLFKHKSGSFCVALPADKREDIIQFLRDNNWCVKKQFSRLVLFLLFYLFCFIAGFGGAYLAHSLLGAQ